MALPDPKTRLGLTVHPGGFVQPGRLPIKGVRAVLFLLGDSRLPTGRNHLEEREEGR